MRHVRGQSGVGVFQCATHVSGARSELAELVAGPLSPVVARSLLNPESLKVLVCKFDLRVLLAFGRHVVEPLVDQALTRVLRLFG